MTKKRHKPSKKNDAKKKKEQIIYIVIAVVLVIFAFLVFGSNKPADTPAQIDTATGYQKFQEGAFLLDVRTPEEWVEYHVDGATLIPLDELESRISEVPSDQDVVVICNSGNRSVVGQDILLSAGYSNVYSISGGIQGWMKAGYPTVSGE